MVDRDLILAKTSSAQKHIRRIEEKAKVDYGTFRKDLDRQESILFNIQMAVQNCIDIAAHIISEEGLGVPGSTSEMFYLLEENGFLSAEVSEKMVKAIGFRNLLVHEYANLDLELVFRIGQKDIQDINKFIVCIFQKLGIS